MAREVLRGISQKQSNGAYSTPIPFGVSSENVEMGSKKILEDEFNRVDNKLPIVAEDDGNNQPSGIDDLNNLTVGTLWLIIEEGTE